MSAPKLPPQTGRRCTQCRKVLPAQEFRVRPSGRLDSWCLTCARALNRARHRYRQRQAARRREQADQAYYDRVLAACKALMRRGLPPTISRIGEEIGSTGRERIMRARRAVLKSGVLDEDRLEDLSYKAYRKANRRGWVTRRRSQAS